MRFGIEDIDLERTRKYLGRGENYIVTKDGLLLSTKRDLSAYDVVGREGLVDLVVLDEEEFDEIRKSILSFELEGEEVAGAEEEEEIDSTRAAQLLHSILDEALKLDASDVHVLPKEKRYLVKVRAEGRLRVMRELRKSHGLMLVNKIKTLAEMDIANSLSPQDGKFSRRVGEVPLEIRVATCPTIFGEKAVLRLQKQTGVFNLKLEDLGFEEEDLKAYREQFYKPYGMILNVGATGQGKTTTFYVSLMELYSKFGEQKSIITVEDPVEIKFEGIDQIEVEEKVGRTFASVLRSALRQDPDVILIGEIRDEETAQIGVRASLTGHLVLATLHAVDSINAVSRLKDLGVSPVLISSTLNCILSQRLVRKLCDCREAREVLSEEREKYGIKVDRVYEPKGCEKCEGTGYRGRIAVIEVLVFDEEVKELVAKGVSEIELRRRLILDKGFQTLWRNGLRKVERGETSLEELLSVVSPDVVEEKEVDVDVREIIYPKKKVKVLLNGHTGHIFDRSRKGLSIVFPKPIPLEFGKKVEIEVEGQRKTFIPKSYGTYGEGEFIVGGVVVG